MEAEQQKPAIEATNHDTLVGLLRQSVAVLTVTMPKCGKKYTFSKLNDIPHGILECECGEETVIKYEEQ